MNRSIYYIRRVLNLPAPAYHHREVDRLSTGRQVQAFRVYMFLLLVLVLQMGCEGFTRKIEVDYRDHITKGVVFSVLSNTDIRDTAFREVYDNSSSLTGFHGNRIFISHSVPPVIWRELFYKAQVSLKSEAGDVPLSFVDLDDEGSNYKAYFGVEEDPIPGRIYDILASFDPDAAPTYVQEWSPVSARDTMPHLVPFSIESVHLDYEEGNYWATPGSGYIDLRIEDEPGRSNMYLVDISAIFQSDSLYSEDQFLVYGRVDRPDKTADLDIFDNNRNNLFHEDDFTREGRKRIHFHFSSTYGSHERDKGAVLIVRLSNLSDNYIRFQRSSQQYAINKGNPFAEPAEIFTNVNNGYGIFALAARSYVEVTVE
ncbi:MAG TPA: DUF4249 family protein [Membranihabitans sp.]|nr:DUF4249 family protein [Membranihabitans sp.]